MQALSLPTITSFAHNATALKKIMLDLDLDEEYNPITDHDMRTMSRRNRIQLSKVSRADEYLAIKARLQRKIAAKKQSNNLCDALQ